MARSWALSPRPQCGSPCRRAFALSDRHQPRALATWLRHLTRRARRASHAPRAAGPHRARRLRRRRPFRCYSAGAAASPRSRAPCAIARCSTRRRTSWSRRSRWAMTRMQGAFPRSGGSIDRPIDRSIDSSIVVVIFLNVGLIVAKPGSREERREPSRTIHQRAKRKVHLNIARAAATVPRRLRGTAPRRLELASGCQSTARGC